MTDKNLDKYINFNYTGYPWDNVALKEICDAGVWVDGGSPLHKRMAPTDDQGWIDGLQELKDNTCNLMLNAPLMYEALVSILMQENLRSDIRNQIRGVLDLVIDGEVFMIGKVADTVKNSMTGESKRLFVNNEE